MTQNIGWIRTKNAGLKTKKETFYETSLHFAVPNGLEPSTSCVTGNALKRHFYNDYQ